MSLSTTGTLHKIFDTESKSGTFKSRDFVIKTPGEYPQFVKFQLVQDRCDTIDQFSPGQEITVFFDLRGREWEGKYFTNLQAWKIQGETDTSF